MKKILFFAALSVLLIVSQPRAYCQLGTIKTSIDINMDGAVRYQQLDGIGVNANTRSWNNGELKPAIDMLIDTMHASVWRVIVESVEKWEDVNDNDDPFTFNWEYYNKLYETPKFRKVWEMVGYLNQRGITDNLMINFMGFAPKWMGIKVIEPRYEEEFVEMLVSFFYYAIEVKHLKIGLIGPTNESDWYNYSEGPHLNGRQMARIYRMLIDRMEALKIMGNIKLVGPDVVVFNNAQNSFIPALMDDPIVWSKVAHLGFHSYGGYSDDIQGLIKSSPYPEMTYWMTEFNTWCSGCDDGKVGTYDYNYSSSAVKFLLEFLGNNATACLVWEGYDSYYEHHAPSLFSWWGILGYNPETKTYTPRKNLFAISQVSKYVLPGSWRISVSEAADSVKILAFYDLKSQKVNIVGLNQSRNPFELKGTLANLPDIAGFDLIYTNSTENLRNLGPIKVTNKSFNVRIPGQCIFTLSGSQNVPGNPRLKKSKK